MLSEFLVTIGYCILKLLMVDAYVLNITHRLLTRYAPLRVG
jgi:hypothetical protein